MGWKIYTNELWIKDMLIPQSWLVISDYSCNMDYWADVRDIQLSYVQIKRKFSWIYFFLQGFETGDNSYADPWKLNQSKNVDQSYRYPINLSAIIIGDSVISLFLLTATDCHRFVTITLFVVMSSVHPQPVQLGAFLFDIKLNILLTVLYSFCVELAGKENIGEFVRISKNLILGDHFLFFFVT